MRVRIYPLALGKIIKHALTDLENEIAGLLVGKYLKRGDVLEIWDTVTGNQKSAPGFVYLDEETIGAAAEWVLNNRPGLYVVGWYHSHPGIGVFLSGIDVETQRRYQKMFSKAVALVIDPLKYAKTGRLSDLDFAVFRINRKGQVVRLATSIGIQRQKLLESTIKGVETMELKYVTTDSGERKTEEPARIEGRGDPEKSLGSVFKRLRGKLSRREE